MGIMNKKVALALAIGAASVTANATPIKTDVIAVVDESASMSGEHAWLSSMIFDLDSSLATAAGSDPFSAQYGLTGFGGASDHLTGHQHDVGGSAFGSASDFSTATASLLTNGGTEDGYSGIDFALNYSLRSDAVTNLILVTDEDRDNWDKSLNYSSILSQMSSLHALLNAVVNVDLRCGDNSKALGLDSEGNGYKADGAGGYSVCSGGHAVNGYGSTVNDYVNLALATGGAAWDLNQLRAGGLTAESFTGAFVAIKVKETIDNTPPTTPPSSSVPEPTTLALMGLGLAGLGLRRRKA